MKLYNLAALLEPDSSTTLVWRSRCLFLNGALLERDDPRLHAFESWAGALGHELRGRIVDVEAVVPSGAGPGLAPAWRPPRAQGVPANFATGVADPTVAVGMDALATLTFTRGRRMASQIAIIAGVGAPPQTALRAMSGTCREMVRTLSRQVDWVRESGIRSLAVHFSVPASPSKNAALSSGRGTPSLLRRPTAI